MYDGDFRLAGHITDSRTSSGMTIYGAHIVGGKIYATFAAFTLFQGGAEDVFDLDGNFLRRLAANGPLGPLQAPWVAVRAPGDFGWASHAPLIGGVEDGHVNVLDPHSGRFLGVLKDTHGNPIAIGGLWELLFDTEDRERVPFSPGPSFPPNTGGYSDGLFGVITASDRDDGDKRVEEKQSISQDRRDQRIQLIRSSAPDGFSGR